MRYHVRIRGAARKTLKTLQESDRRRIDFAIHRLSETPRPAGCIKIAGRDDLYRIRVGDYRILYTVQDEVFTVMIVRIAHRSIVYRPLE